jgi:hypothetical protein
MNTQAASGPFHRRMRIIVNFRRLSLRCGAAGVRSCCGMEECARILDAAASKEASDRWIVACMPPNSGHNVAAVYKPAHSSTAAIR